MVMPIPKGLSFSEAAAIPEVYMTAYLNLFYVGGAKSGETLLMNAGASGLASAVIPMAKAFGIRVITSTRNEKHLEEIKSLGADIIINTSKEKTADVLKRELEAGRPVDVAIDCIGGSFMGECLHYLKHGARWIMIASLGGDKTEIDLRNIFVRNVRIVGSTLRSRAPEVKAQILASLVSEVWEKVEQNLVKPTIYKVLPITQVEEAHAILERNENVGKVVMTI
jgi:NADPH2:quinone reductase